MPNNREDFAPFWLAMAILDDAECQKAVEKFIQISYKDIHGRDVHGGLHVRNLVTGSEHTAADRYSSIVVFLASSWTMNAKFLLTGRDLSQEIDTPHMLLLKPPTAFKRALAIGEEAYRKEKQRPNLSSANIEPPRTGRYVWVWDGDEE
jgi:hypothetical protein